MSLPESILGVLDYSYILSFWRNHKTHKLSSYLKRTKEYVFLRTSTKKKETSWQDIIRSSSNHHSCIYQLCNLGKSFTFLGFITIKMNMSTPMDFLSTQLTCTSRNLECWSRQIPTYAPSKLFQDRNHSSGFVSYFSVLSISHSDFEICKEESLTPFINIYLRLCSFSVSICGGKKKTSPPPCCQDFSSAFSLRRPKWRL